MKKRVKTRQLSLLFSLMIIGVLVLIVLISISNYNKIIKKDLKGELGTAGIFGSYLSNEYYQHSDVLLLCNPASNDSMTICNYFLSKRPTLTHALNLSGISTGESATSAVYLSILNQTSYYLNHTNDAINYIVLTKGIPLYSSYRSYSGSYSVDSMLAYDLRNESISYSSYSGKEETFSHSKFGFYITTRLDGYDVNDVKNLIDRSTLANRDLNALTSGNFVLDESPFFNYVYLLKTKNHLQNDLGYNVIYGNTSISPYFIRNATNVVGYYSWGSNDAYYWTSSNVLINNGFTVWSSDNLIATNWTVGSGAIYRGNAYSKTDIAEINTTGISQIYQDYNNNYAGTRKFVYYIGYGYNNFIGNVVLNLTGLDSNNNTIVNYSKTLISKTSSSNLSSITSNMALKYFPNIRSSKIRVSLIANITNGSFYIDYILLDEIAPHNTWINGSIGTTAVSTSARSFLTTTSYGQSLIADLIRDGICGVEGFVSEPGLGAIADSYSLFDRYSKGYNLGDSFYMASLNLNWKDIIIGDPKTVIKTLGISRCSLKTDCGTDAWTGNPFCKSGNVYQNYTIWTCNNPGTIYSLCNSSITAQLKQTCGTGYNCTNGGCTAICTNDCTASGLKRCSRNYSQTCGNYDSDNCLEWGGDINCNYGCNSSTGICKPCVANCTGKQCGNNGCGGYCGNLNGNCPNGQSCNTTGQCVNGPDIYAPRISFVEWSVTTTTAMINWSTSEDTNSSINYGINISNLSLNSINYSFVLNHTMILTSLTSSTIYYYNITNCDSAGNCAKNGTYNFTTNTETITEPIVNPQGGGVGNPGSGTPTQKKCIENWSCENWGECKNGIKSRFCGDNNKCNTILKKPLTLVSCIETTTNSSEKPFTENKNLNLIYPVIAVILVIIIIVLYFIKKFMIKSTINLIYLLN